MKQCVAVVLVLVVVAAAGDVTVGRALPGTSCSNRCGDDDGTLGCRCSVDCIDTATCCSDYEDVCLTCSNRCTDSVLPLAPCQCDSECGSRGNCCEDFQDVCGGSPVTTNVTDAELLSLTEELYALDGNNVAEFITVQLQGLTSSSATDDRAPLPLYGSVEEQALGLETIVLLEALRDNYQLQVTEEEDNTAAEQAEVAAFLDAVMATPLMVRLDQFMTEKQLVNGSLRANIEQIWFTPYSRSGSVLGSSGFEHVFMGELNGDSVGGFHNWITFFREEQAGYVNYMGFLEYRDLAQAGYVLTDRFTWRGANKPIGGGLVGTSPEFELALDTLCFYARPNSLCPVQTNGREYSIQTYDYDGAALLGSAYPIV